MANMLFANNCNTTLSGSITNVATTLSVTSATGFPSPTGSQYFYCTLADAATQTTIEIVKVTAVSGTTFTIVRGQDGTSGTAFSSGDVVSLRLVRASLNDFPKLDENNTFTFAPTFNTALGVASGGTGVTSATGTGPSAAVVLNQAPAINSPVITAYSTSTVPLKVCGLSGQFTELFDVYTYNGGTLAFQINSSGAIATGTWNGSVIGAAYGGTGEAGTLTGILYGNGTSAHTVATTAQLLSGIGTLPVANGGTGITSLPVNYIPYGNGTNAFQANSSLQYDGANLNLGNGGTLGFPSNLNLLANGGSSAGAFTFKNTAGNNQWLGWMWNNAAGATSFNLFVNFGTDSSFTGRGSITYNSTAGLLSFNTTSDQRLKTNIVDAPSALDKINSIQIRSFDWIETGNHNDFGVIAQELVTVAPEAVTLGDNANQGQVQRPWAVDTSALNPAMIKAIQELNAQLTALQSDYSAYKAAHP